MAESHPTRRRPISFLGKLTDSRNHKTTRSSEVVSGVCQIFDAVLTYEQNLSRMELSRTIWAPPVRKVSVTLLPCPSVSTVMIIGVWDP
jgi:hypothetical protein